MVCEIGRFYRFGDSVLRHLILHFFFPFPPPHVFFLCSFFLLFTYIYISSFFFKKNQIYIYIYVNNKKKFLFFVRVSNKKPFFFFCPLFFSFLPPPPPFSQTKKNGKKTHMTLNNERSTKPESLSIQMNALHRKKNKQKRDNKKILSEEDDDDDEDELVRRNAKRLHEYERFGGKIERDTDKKKKVSHLTMCILYFYMLTSFLTCLFIFFAVIDLNTRNGGGVRAFGSGIRRSIVWTYTFSASTMISLLWTSHYACTGRKSIARSLKPLYYVSLVGYTTNNVVSLVSVFLIKYILPDQGIDYALDTTLLFFISTGLLSLTPQITIVLFIFFGKNSTE
jgi:hypothetical protein